MKKVIFAVLLTAFCAGLSFAQTKPKVGILPFTGAGTDGEAIARLFSYNDLILNTFTVIPRTSQVNALVAEQEFQSAGYTDSDTIARIGNMLNADYVISGHIRPLGTSKLIIATIINVQTFEQLAGDYKEYKAIEEVQLLIPGMARILCTASTTDISTLPRLAIAPFEITDRSVNALEAEALAQILAIEIGKTGKYAVLPRTSVVQDAMSEQNIQASGRTADQGRAGVGRAINAQFVLSGNVSTLGNMNMFEASILDMETSGILTGGYRNYMALADGTTLMPELAVVLTGQRSTSARSNEDVIRRQQRAAETERQAAERKAASDAFWKKNHTSMAPWTLTGGYIFQPDFPLGLRAGLFGLYANMSWNTSGGKTSSDIYTFGYAFNVIDRWAIFPVGGGFRRKVGKPTDFVIELGYELIPLSIDTVSISIHGTYRLIALKESSFTIGTSMCFSSIW